MNFSIVLIAKNEATTLPRMMESLKEFQAQNSEVVLVDTGSTDGTQAVAQALGCKVYGAGTRFVKTFEDDHLAFLSDRFIVEGEKKLTGGQVFDYSEARNYAAWLATNDLVGMPDCDEAFTVFDLEKIAAVFESSDKLEYEFVYSHNEDGGEAIKFRHSKFYNRTKLEWTGLIHEVLTPRYASMTAFRSVYVPETIMKLEHFANIESDRSHYLVGLAEDCYSHSDDDRKSHYFGRELLWNGRPKSAIREFKRHIAMGAWEAERAQSMIFIGDAFIALKNVPKALQWYHKAFTTDSSRREALLRLASYYWHHEDPKRTAAYASAALAIPKSETYMDRVEDYTYLPHEMLYWAFWWMGDKQKSQEHWQRALSYRPNCARYLNDRVFYEDEAVA